MKIIGTFVFGLLLTFGATAMAEGQRPFWRNGDLVCPDGSVGKPAFMPHVRPTAHDLDVECSVRAENKRLHDFANRPVHTVTPQERQREREDAAKFIGQPK